MRATKYVAAAAAALSIAAIAVPAGTASAASKPFTFPGGRPTLGEPNPELVAAAKAVAAKVTLAPGDKIPWFGTGGQAGFDGPGLPNRISISNANRSITATDLVGPVARFTPKGVLDTTFGGTGVVDAAKALASVGAKQFGIATAVDATGRVYVGGCADDASDGIVVRLTADGELDDTFMAPIAEEAGACVSDIGVLKDNTVLVAATFSGGSVVTHLFEDGTFDGSFAGGNTVLEVPGIVTAMDVRKNRVALQVLTFTGPQVIGLFTTKGLPVAGFGTGGWTETEYSFFEFGGSTDDPLTPAIPGGVVLDATGLPIVGYTEVDPEVSLFASADVLRYDATGARDASYEGLSASGGVLTLNVLFSFIFPTSGDFAILPQANSLANDAQGRTVFGFTAIPSSGGSDDLPVALVGRLNPDGSNDTTFGTDGIVHTGALPAPTVTVPVGVHGNRVIAGGAVEGVDTVQDVIIALRSFCPGPGCASPT